MTDEEASPVPLDRVIDKSLLAARPGTGRITIKREKDFGGSACAYRVFVDAKPVADMKTGEKVVFFLPPGDHIFGADPGRVCGGRLIEVSGVVREDKPIAFRIGVGAVNGFYFNATAF
jgi:hypothetical protein